MNPSPPVKDRQGSLTTVCCYYAQEHLRSGHPHCEATPLVAYGPIVLCAPCDKRRSAVGRSIAARPLPGTHLAHLERTAMTARHADSALTAAAVEARQAGASWAQIGQAVGITRQAAQQRWGAAHQHQPARS